MRRERESSRRAQENTSRAGGLRSVRDNENENPKVDGC